MQVNDVIRVEEKTYRVLAINENELFIIDCADKSMPVFIPKKEYQITEGPITLPLEELSPVRRSQALKRFSMIASILPVVADKSRRTEMINQASALYGKSTQSIRAYLRRYLIYQDIAALAPADNNHHKELTQDEKNMRWGLNKFYYTQHKNSLPTAYRMMLNEKYCDENGKLLEKYPTFYQFDYFYRKTRKLENFYISRDGLKHYQSNNRPLLGDGVQEFAPNIGTAMLDGTVCDIYLVNDLGELIGRPILVTAVDANTSLCLGYSLLWEGGIYSLRQLLFNIIEDKEELCRRFGISVEKSQWNISALPGIIVTDMGTEYTGATFEQIAELGVTVINLPAYRPELKGVVEKFFDVVQDLYKDILKGKGVILPDFQKRGAPDYRKDARLTIDEFEKIIVRCIVYYNSERLIENYPYTEAMLSNDIKPYACNIWNYKLSEPGLNLIFVSKNELSLTLLPRTVGTFTRYGLKVNRLRYHAEGYKNEYLKGGEVIVSYNPDDCGYVWIKDNKGAYVRFSLIEIRFKDMSLDEINAIKLKQAQIIKNESEENLQAKLRLMQFIETVSEKEPLPNIKIKGSGKVKTSERKAKHKDASTDG